MVQRLFALYIPPHLSIINNNLLNNNNNNNNNNNLTNNILLNNNLINNPLLNNNFINNTLINNILINNILLNKQFILLNKWSINKELILANPTKLILLHHSNLILTDLFLFLILHFPRLLHQVLPTVEDIIHHNSPPFLLVPSSSH